MSDDYTHRMPAVGTRCHAYLGDRHVEMGSVEIDVDADKDDRAVVDELAHDERCSHKASGRDEVSVVLSALEHGRKVVEGLGEHVSDRRKVEKQEVATRWFARRSAGVSELRIEIAEDCWSTRTERRVTG